MYMTATCETKHSVSRLANALVVNVSIASLHAN